MAKRIYGSTPFHVDGEGTVLTTEMSLLGKGRNPEMTK